MHSKETWMNEAVTLSQNAIDKNEGGPFGCVVVKNGVVIARGNNKVTSSNDPTAHAEVVAIREACKALNSFQLEGCEIYTSCEPCPMCLGAIYWARPDVIYYANSRADAAAIGFDDAFIYDEIGVEPGQRQIKMIHLPLENARKVFNAWKIKTDKIAY